MPDSKKPTSQTLSPFRASLAPTRAYERANELISSTDPAAAVAALSVPEIYTLIKELGFGDSQDLLVLATPDQVRGCLDLDIWDKDRVSTEALQPWIAALLETDFEVFGRSFVRMDQELAAWILSTWVRVYDHSLEETAPDWSDRPMITTPDTFFTLEIITDDEDEARIVSHVIDWLYRFDLHEARHVIMAARSEMSSYLEEMAFRWRSGRMADLGYPDFYEAMEIFRPLNPASVEIGEQTAYDPGPVPDGEQARVPRALPVPLAEQLLGRAFLGAALDGITDRAEAERLQAALVYAVNRALAAAQVSPGDEQSVKVGADHAAATLALGLETVAGGDLDRAIAALQSISLTRLHRVGYTVTLRLSRMARALAPRAVAAGDTDSAMLGALLAARPWFPEELDTPPAAGWRAFESRADIRTVAERLTRLAFRIAVAEQAMGGNLIALAGHTERRPDLDAFARTAMLRFLGGGELSSAPLGPDDFRRADLSPAAGPRALAALAARLDESGVTAGREYLAPLVDCWLGELRATAAAMAGTDTLDRSFIDTVFLEN